MAIVTIDRDAAHEAAQRELSKPIYPKENFSEHFSDWINDFIYRLIVRGSEIPGGWFTVAVLLTLVAVAAIVAVRVARRTMRTNRAGDFQLFGNSGLSAAEHRASAERFASQGDWTAAIRHRLRAVARQLEENDVLNPVPGRTANELARDAGASLPDLAPELSSAAASFNDVTYGKRPGTEAAYQRIATLDEQIRTRRAPVSGEIAAHVGAQTWADVQ